jgi:hypothetical protein
MKMIAKVTVYSKNDKYPIEFPTIGEAMKFYEELLLDHDIVKAELTTDLADQPVAQFDKSATVNGVMYNIIG